METSKERAYREAAAKRKDENDLKKRKTRERMEEAAQREIGLARAQEKVAIELLEEEQKFELQKSLKEKSKKREEERIRQQNELNEKIKQQIQLAEEGLEKKKKLAEQEAALEASNKEQKQKREKEVEDAKEKLKELQKKLDLQAFEAEEKRKEEQKLETKKEEIEQKEKEKHNQEIARLKADGEKLKNQLATAETQRESLGFFGSAWNSVKNAVGRGSKSSLTRSSVKSQQAKDAKSAKFAQNEYPDKNPADEDPTDEEPENEDPTDEDPENEDSKNEDSENEHPDELSFPPIETQYATVWDDPQFFWNRAQDWVQMKKEHRAHEINKHYGTDIALRTSALSKAILSLGLDARVLCMLLLDNKVEPTSRSLPRKGKLQQIENRWFIITVKEEPRVTDHLWLLTTDLETKKKQTTSLGFLNFVRKIKNTGSSESMVFEIKMSGSNAKDVLAYAFHETNPKGEFDILMEEFSLDMNATCVAASSVPEVIATFVQKDADGKLFHELIASGTTFEGQPLTPDQVPICLPDEHVARLRDGLRARMEHRLPSAELQRIWELQQQKHAQRQEENRLRRQTHNRSRDNNDDEDLEQSLEDWKISESDIADLQENQIDTTYQGVVASSVYNNGGFGGVVGYDAYLRSVAEFRETFSALLSNGVRDTEATTNNFVVQFIVPMNIYEETRKLSLQNWASISGTLGRCKTSFIMSVQEQLFRAMLFELNGLVQTSGTAQNTKPPSLPQICALSWLLFYSQLPIFVTKLSAITVSHLQELQTSRDWNHILKEVSRAFMTDIFVKMLPSMLPSNSAGFGKFEIDIVFYIRKYVLPVAEAVWQNVETFIAHSAPSNC